MKKILYFFIGFFTLVNLSQAQNKQSDVGKPIVIKPVYFDISPPLRDMYQDPNAKVDRSWKDGVVINHNPKNVFKENNPNAIYSDPNVQTKFGGFKPDTTAQSFDGTGTNNGVCPPDPTGDVGPNHFVQIVNLQYAVYNKTGTKLLGPLNTSQIWSGLPNNSNDGDGIVLYDEVANRWLMSQFSVPGSGPFYENVAISQTSDPTGSYFRYQYVFSEMPDYPKLGVWLDAYYICVNRFSGNNFVGPGAGAFDRTKMLAGDPAATMIFFPVASTQLFHGLPADCDGTFPPAGTPGYFTWSTGTKMNIYEFHADWTTPTNSTFTLTNQLNVIPFSSIPQDVGLAQQGTSVKLAALSNNYSLMNRLQFHYFSDHWSMVTNGTINIGSNVAGIRWYEFRKTGTDPWSIYQQATYAPSDGKSRWNGSIAMDNSGNIALAFSITSSSMYPSIHYTGRMSCDPLNQFTIAESSIVNGGGSQTNTWSGNPSRWGDYSALTLDPTVAGTFWYTNEYYSSTSQNNWKTRIASFSYANVLCVTATATPSTVCSGQSSQLNASASGGSGTFTYSWTSVPPGFSSTQQNPIVNPTVTTQYVAAVNDGSSTKTDTTTVTIIPEPTADAGPDVTYPNTTPLFPASGTATSYSSVKWLTDGDGHFNIDTVPASLYYPGPVDKNNGGVNLTFMAYPLGTCTTTATDVVHITLTFPAGTGDNSSGVFGVTISPNPSNGIFFLVIHGIRNAEARISISDLTGKEIYSENEISSTNNLTKEINMAGYPKGIYLIKVRTEQQSTTKKLVLQ
jgi:Secretion system C-terminal sorting domain